MKYVLEYDEIFIEVIKTDKEKPVEQLFTQKQFDNCPAESTGQSAATQCIRQTRLLWQLCGMGSHSQIVL